MIIQPIDYWAIAAPLILALTAGLVLLLDAFVPVSAAVRRPYGRVLLGGVTLGGILAALAVVVAQAVQGGQRRTFCVPGASVGAPVGARGDTGAGLSAAESCSFVVDRFTLVFAGLALVAGVVIVLLSMAEPAGERIPIGEWLFLLLCTLVGAVLLPASRDLIMLVVALELVSLPVFALTALKRYDGRASEAALKLFLVSVVSTAVTLFGISLLYGLTGSVFLDRIAVALAGGPADASLVLDGLTAGTGSGVVTVAVVLVLAGFAFKVAAVPFHSWAGDVYQGAPIPVAALLSVISKAAGFAGLILILTVGLAGQAAMWGAAIAVIAALTMTVGNVLAIRQRAAVRLLAWSSVAQSGYILAPLAVWAVHSGPGGDPVVGASMAYLVFYAAMNLGAFAVVMLVARAATRNDLADYSGLAFRRPGPALALAFFLICLAGLPPGLAGLFAKVVVFREIVDGGLGWLAVVMAINTVIGLYYYLAWTAKLFTPPSAGESAARSMPAMVAIGFALLVTVVFSVAPQVVLTIVG